MKLGKKLRMYMCYVHGNLIIAKLEAYGFSQNARQYTRSYLTNRQKRGRVNSNFNNC